MYRFHVDSTYRLIISTRPIQSFPISVLSKGFKLVCEAPKGLRSTILTMLDDIDSCEWFNASKPVLWPHLLGSLLLFHAIVKGRNTFNPVGWKETYDFDSGDFICAKSILLLFVDQFDGMQWTALKYITSQIVYGGRITDNMDQRCLSCIMDFLYCDAGHKANHPLKYHNEMLAEVNAFTDLQKNVRALPDVDDIEMYGMHTNAISSLELKDSIEFLNNVSNLRLHQENTDVLRNTPDADQEGLRLVEAILSTFSSKQISRDIKNPPNPSDPMDIVRQHEIAKCNGLFSIMRRSLERTLSAVWFGME
jgi:dynein heavy chain